MLNLEQSKALSAVVSGHNVLLCGQAGTGKSHTLKVIYNALRREKRVSLLCTTGMACLQFNEFDAKTVHSWAGLYDGRYDILTLKNLIETDDKYDHVKKNVLETDCIIIDEISMLSAKLFEQLEAVCSVVCENNKVFGGKQIVLCGDFYQLPPVPDALHQDDGSFCFESKVFKASITQKIVLVQVMRQEEELLIKVVRETAVGTVSGEVDTFLRALQRLLGEEAADKTVHLFARNIDATLYNSDCLEKLDTEAKIYKSKVNSGSSKYLNKILAPNYLHLRLSCPVILLVNIGGKLVNGLQGIVRAFNDDSVTVYFPQINESHNIQRKLFTKYDVKSKSIIAKREQFPLVLSYGLTIHKAQGMTLERVVVHCKGMFQPGQLSVAIGRAVSSNGLSLLDYRKGLCLVPKTVISQFSVLHGKKSCIS